jgi:hypothetical protein
MNFIRKRIPSAKFDVAIFLFFFGFLFVACAQNSGPGVIANEGSNVTSADPTPTRLPLTPTEIVSGVINESPLQADELGIIYAKYPQITVPMLGGRSFEISGKVIACSFGGMEKEIAEVQLDTGGKANVYVYKDLGRTGINHGMEWKDSGRAIRLVDWYDDGKSSIFCTRGESFRAFVTLKKETPSSLYFDCQSE